MSDFLRPSTISLRAVAWSLALLGVTLLVGPGLLAQSSKPLTNDDVVLLVKEEVDVETILGMIKLHKPAFDLSAGAILSLKRAGVSDKIIQAMLDRTAVAEAAPPTAAPTDSVPSRDSSADGKAPNSGPGSAAKAIAQPEFTPWTGPVVPKENGIYYEKDDRFTEIFGKPVVRTQTAGFAKTILTAGM